MYYRIHLNITRALDKREYLMIFFLISHQTICCEPSSEPPHVVTPHLNPVQMRGHNMRRVR